MPLRSGLVQASISYVIRHSETLPSTADEIGGMGGTVTDRTQQQKLQTYCAGPRAGLFKVNYQPNSGPIVKEPC